MMMVTQFLFAIDCVLGLIVACVTAATLVSALAAWVMMDC